MADNEVRIVDLPVVTTPNAGDKILIDGSTTRSITISDFLVAVGSQPGPPNSLAIGTVASGASAAATITGASPSQTLNLTLPKGDTGATGPTGPTGPSGAVGVTGTPTAGHVATFTNSTTIQDGGVLAASATTDTTNAANISSGTLPAARLPNPSATTLGGIQSLAAVASNWVRAISTSGVPTASQPAFTDISGSVAGTQMPAHTGDVTTSAGSVVTTIAAGVVTYAKLASAALSAAGDFIGNTASKVLTAAAVWLDAAPVTLTDASTVTPNFGTGFNFIWTIGATGRTIANPTSPKAGQTGVIYLVQDATGSRTITTWGSQYKFSGGTKPTLSTSANAIDVLSYHCKSTTEIECFFTAGMA